MKKVVIGVVVVVFVALIAGYYVSQNLKHVISPKEAEDILNKHFSRDVERLNEELGHGTFIEWDRFACSKDLSCTSPKIALHIDNMQFVVFKDTVIHLHKVTLDDVKASAATNISLSDEMFRAELAQLGLKEVMDHARAFVPTRLECEQSSFVDGKQSLAGSDGQCHVITPSAKYDFRINMDLVHPIYKGENLMSVLLDPEKFDLAHVEKAEDVMFGLKNIDLKITSTGLGDAIYNLMRYMQDISREEFNAELKSLADDIANNKLFSDFDMESAEDKKKALMEVSQKIASGIFTLLTQKEGQLSVAISLKDPKNIKRLALHELDDNLIFDALSKYFNIEVQSR